MKIIPPEMFDNPCKIGQGKACCRYMVATAEDIYCAKHDPLAKVIDSKVEEMTAQGNNCKGLK